MPSSRKSYVVDDRYDDFIASEVEAGRFNNAGEVIDEALRMLEEHQARLREEARLQETRKLIASADAQIAAGKGIRITSKEQFMDLVLERGAKNQAT